jgi:uncharacterized integral membrane protein
MRLKAYVLLGVSLLLLIAVTVLIVGNLGDTWTLHLYFKDVELVRGVWLLLTTIGAVLLYIVLKRTLPMGVRAWRSANRKQRDGEALHRLETLEKQASTKPQE